MARPISSQRITVSRDGPPSFTASATRCASAGAWFSTEGGCTGSLGAPWALTGGGVAVAGGVSCVADDELTSGVPPMP